MSIVAGPVSHQGTTSNECKGLLLAVGTNRDQNPGLKKLHNPFSPLVTFKRKRDASHRTDNFDFEAL